MKPQIITTDAGDELVVLSRSAYDALLQAAEDARDCLVAAEAEANLATGRDIVVPIDVAERIFDGENRLVVLREWRGLTTNDLALRTGMAETAISAFEKVTIDASPDVWRRLAIALDVPLHLLMDPAHASAPS